MARGFRDEDSDSSRTHSIADVKALKATEKALLCVIEGEEVWVPTSQIHDASEVYEAGGEGKLVVTMWLAEQKGWV